MGEETGPNRADTLLQEAEERLERIRLMIEDHVRRNLDAKQAWLLYRSTAIAVQTMRQSSAAIGELHRLASGSNRIGLTWMKGVAWRSARVVSYRPGATFDPGGRNAPQCHVIETGLASVCSDYHGTAVEVAMMSAGAVAGLPALLDGPAGGFSTVAVVPCRTIAIERDELARHLDSSLEGQRFVRSHAQIQMSTAMILAACNAAHSVQQRVARWIATASARLGPIIEPVSHDRLAGFLALRRSSVTVALHDLEGLHAIKSRRNAIQVRDPEILAALSCGCERAIAEETARASGQVVAPGTESIGAVTV